MKRRIMFFMTILLLTGLHLCGVTALMPRAGELPGWLPGGKPEHVKGEDLFLMINGGAEIYHEYGFKQAVSEVYKKDGKTVNLEIYEMNSAASAYGVYTFKIGEGGKDLPIGNGAKLEDYYLNAWKGNVLVTLTGFDSEKETVGGLIDIARVILGKIKESGEKPSLSGLLPKENLIETNIKYLRGNLALFNQYEFAAENIFALEEGVIGDYGEYKIFIFKYRDGADSRKWFANAAAHLKDSPLFKDCVLDQDSCSVTDRSGQPLYIKPFKNYILIVLGKSKKKAAAILQKMVQPRSPCGQG